MATARSFLTTRYGAYHQRAVPKPDEALTHVGPGTPGGEYLRRFWQPVIRADELGAVPRRIRVMKEDLVVFRDLGGRIGVLQLHCSHRGTSLEFGRIAERGIRCCYHGWLFDVDGAILETPGEPAGSTLRDRLCHGAYPAREYKGLVFIYMGPPDKEPVFPLYDTFELAGYDLLMSPTNVLPCNWLQIKENSMDPWHTVFLHTTVNGTQFTDAYGEFGVVEWQLSPIGMIYVHARRVDDLVWVHINDAILPNIHQYPPIWEEAREEKIFQRPMGTRWSVPIDDDQTMNIGWTHLPKGMDRSVLRGAGFGQTADRPYEERQREPGDYDAQTSQRAIAVHALEHLGSTDRGITMYRKLLRDGIRAVKRGQDPMGVLRADPGVIPTYSQDTVLRIPREANDEADRALLLETGRKVAAGHYLDRRRG